MGAYEFFQFQQGEDPKKAFRDAVFQAQYDHGHAGYTGTVAEKDEFVIVQKEPMLLTDAESFAEQLMADDDPRVTDKWGPAGAIRVKGGRTFRQYRPRSASEPVTFEDVEYDGWLFFGWASA